MLVQQVPDFTTEYAFAARPMMSLQARDVDVPVGVASCAVSVQPAVFLLCRQWRSLGVVNFRGALLIADEDGLDIAAHVGRQRLVLGVHDANPMPLQRNGHPTQ